MCLVLNKTDKVCIHLWFSSLWQMICWITGGWLYRDDMWLFESQIYNCCLTPSQPQRCWITVDGSRLVESQWVISWWQTIGWVTVGYIVLTVYWLNRSGLYRNDRWLVESQGGYIVMTDDWLNHNGLYRDDRWTVESQGVISWWHVTGRITVGYIVMTDDWLSHSGLYRNDSLLVESQWVIS